MREAEMVGWHHQLDRPESEQALRDGEGQGSLPCCRPWGHRELDTAERLKNNNVVLILLNLFVSPFSPL